MNAVFYRYIRPQRFSSKRAQLQTLPRGGICLRFQELPEGDLFFTYARCHPDDYFNKDVARVIADERARHALEHPQVLTLLRLIPWSQNTRLLIHAVIRRCRQMNIDEETPLVQRYMKLEYLGFADVLEQLESANGLEALRLEAWKKGISNTGSIIYQGLNK